MLKMFVVREFSAIDVRVASPKFYGMTVRAMLVLEIEYRILTRGIFDHNSSGFVDFDD